MTQSNDGNSTSVDNIDNTLKHSRMKIDCDANMLNKNQTCAMSTQSMSYSCSPLAGSPFMANVKRMDNFFNVFYQFEVIGVTSWSGNSMGNDQDCSGKPIEGLTEIR